MPVTFPAETLCLLVIGRTQEPESNSANLEMSFAPGLHRAFSKQTFASVAMQHGHLMFCCKDDSSRYCLRQDWATAFSLQIRRPALYQKNPYYVCNEMP